MPLERFNEPLDLVSTSRGPERWPDGVDLTDQRAGIIGTGSTAIQITSAVVGAEAGLKVF